MLCFSRCSFWLGLGLWDGSKRQQVPLDSTKEEGTCPRPCKKSVTELCGHLECPPCRTMMNKSALTPVIYPYCSNEVLIKWW